MARRFTTYKLALWSAGAVVAVAAIWTAYYSWRGPDGTVSYGNYLRIRNGMTLDEVERILGPGKEIDQPPFIGDYSRPPGQYARAAVEGDEFYRWQAGYDSVTIGFRSGKVCDKYYKNWNYP
jgi:hypothetical protein